MTIWRYINVVLLLLLLLFITLGKYNPEGAGLRKNEKKTIQNGYDAQSVQSEAYYYYYIYT